METNKNDVVFNNPKVASILAYLSLIGWIIAVLILNKPKQEIVSFHIRQALGINLLFIVCGFVFIVPILGWIVGFVGICIGAILWIIGVITALSGEYNTVPLLGAYFQEWVQGNIIQFLVQNIHG